MYGCTHTFDNVPQNLIEIVKVPHIKLLGLGAWIWAQGKYHLSFGCTGFAKTPLFRFRDRCCAAGERHPPPHRLKKRCEMADTYEISQSAAPSSCPQVVQSSSRVFNKCTPDVKPCQALPRQHGSLRQQGHR